MKPYTAALALLLSVALGLAAAEPVPGGSSAPPGSSPQPLAPQSQVAVAAPAAQVVDPSANAAGTGDIPVAMKALDDRQRLSPGDRVSYRVVEDREDPRPLIVMDSGELEIPHIGRLKVQDKTCFQIASEVRVLLEKDYYHRATVTISVDALSPLRGKVYVYGAVKAPGPINVPADGSLTLSKAILLANGFADFAKQSSVTVQRKATDGTGNTLIYEINVQEILEKGRNEKDLPVQADDYIFVPQKKINF